MPDRHVADTTSPGASRWLAILDRLPQPVAVFSAIRNEHGEIVDFRVEHVNAAACRDLQRPREDQLGRPLSGLVRDDSYVEACRAAMTSGRAVDRRTGDLELHVEPDGDAVVAWWQRSPAEPGDRRVPEGAGPPALTQLQAVYDALDVGLVVFDAHGQAVIANAAVARLGSYPSVADLQRGLGYFAERFELFELDGGARVPTEHWPVTRVLRGERVNGLELVTRRKDTGQESVIRFSGEPMHDGDGRLVFAVIFIRDVTERVRREDALRASEQRAHLTLELAHAGTFDLDLTGRAPPAVTEGLKRLFGFDPAEQLSTEQYVRRVHPEDRERVTAAIQRSIDTATGHYIEYRIGELGAPEVWVASRAEIARDPSGRASRLVGVVIDITERRRADDALRASEARFRALADSMPQLVWIASPTGVVDYYNARVREYAGIDELADGTWAWQPVVHPEDLDRTVRTWNEAVVSSTPYACEHRVRMADGSFRWHVSRARLVGDQAGPRWFGTATDIHEQKLAEEGLRRAAAIRDQVVSVVVHDLRNPLSMVQYALFVMRQVLAACPDGELRRRGDAAVARTERQATKMERLLDELLDSAALQAGRPLGLKRRACDLVALARELVAAHASGTADHPMEVRAASPSVVGHWDADRIERVLGNLLSNAVKYSPAGKPITVEVEQVDDFGIVHVSDRGIGIRAQDLERIFEWFTRTEDAERVATGAGLGLAGARRIAEQHGGALTVESTPGAGSTFTLKLPL